MRVRYQYIDQDVHAECDLSDRQAKKRFLQLKADGLCEWVELVGEDEENYMDILDAHDKTKEAILMAKVLKELGFR